LATWVTLCCAKAGIAKAVAAATAATPISDSLVMDISSLMVFQSTHDPEEKRGQCSAAPKPRNNAALAR
jgi:hypothetical protein